MIEDIEELGSVLKIEPLVQLDLAAHGEVQLVVTEAAKSIAAQRALPQRRRN